MIVLRTPKGWTGPKEVDGVPVEGTWRAHQVPLGEVRTNPGHLRALEEWMRGYRPEELFVDGRLAPELAALAPAGERRMGANPHANGGLLLRDLQLPDIHEYAVDVHDPGTTLSAPTRALGVMLRDVMTLNAEHRDFRLFGPDETESNRLGAVYEVTAKAWNAEILPVDVNLAPGEGGSWRSSPSTPAKAGWRATCSLAGMVFSRATRPSSTSWTPCSISTPSG